MGESALGRPSTYSDELGERVCDVFESEVGQLRAAFAAREDLPTISTVYRWEEAYPQFRERLARARKIRAHLMADEAIDIADHNANDTITKTARDGSEYEVADHEWINRSRLRVETRLRLAKALNQGVYGDKMQQSGELEIRYRIHRGPKPE